MGIIRSLPTAESITWAYNEVMLGKVFIVTSPGIHSYSDKDRTYLNRERLDVDKTFVLCDAECIDIEKADTIGSGSVLRVVFKILLGSQIRYIQIHPHDFNLVHECTYFKEMV